MGKKIYSFSMDKETRNLCLNADLLDGRSLKIKGKTDQEGNKCFFDCSNWSQFVCKAIREKIIRSTSKTFEREVLREEILEAQERYTKSLEDLRSKKEEYKRLTGKKEVFVSEFREL